MQVLNFPTYPFRIKNRENKPYVFDIIRKKFVQIQAEEWVRQHLIHYLVFAKNIPQSKIRMHICWGNYEGPHSHDISLEKILPLVLIFQKNLLKRKFFLS